MAQTIYLSAGATQKDITNAINSLTDGGTIVFPKDSTIDLTSTLRIKIDTQKITLDLNGSELKVGNLNVGIEAFGVEKPLADVKLGTDAKGNATLTYDQLPDDIAVGRWLKVVADDDLPGDHIDAGDNGNATNLGQAAKILAINGNTVTLEGGLVEQSLYQTNVRASVYASGSIEIKNGSLDGPMEPDGSSNLRLIRVASLTDASISDVTFSDAANGITIANSVNAEITDVSGTNMGSVVQSATSLNTSINGLFAEHVVHGVIVHTTGTVDDASSSYNYGADIGMKTSNAVVYDASRSAFDFHSESRYGTYSNSLAFDSQMFGGLRGIGNSFVDSGGAGNAYGVQFFEYGVGDGRDATVTNMTLRETTNYSFMKSGNVANNTVEDSSFESYGRGYSIASSAVAMIDTLVKEIVTDDDDVLTGTAAADKLLGGKGTDSLDGLDGDDYIWGGAGSDLLTGGTGRDRFAFNALDEGGDIIKDFTAGANGDVLDVSVLGIRLGWDQGDYLGQGLIKLVQSGKDALVQARAADGTWTTLATLEGVKAKDFSSANLQVKLSEAYPTADLNPPLSQTVGGTDAANGSGGKPAVVASAHFYGTAKNDWFKGSAGIDEFHGSVGDDGYVFDHVDDRVTGERVSEGIDSIWTSVDVDLRQHANIENLRMQGTTDINGTGSEIANTITGNGANNIIGGGLGNDTLWGKGGSDTFRFAEYGAANKDNIWDFDADDKLMLDKSVFVSLDSDQDGILDAGAFVIGNGSTGRGPQIVYDRNSGNLYYDANGSTAGGVEDIAYIGKKLAFFDQADILIA